MHRPNAGLFVWIMMGLHLDRQVFRRKTALAGNGAHGATQAQGGRPQDDPGGKFLEASEQSGYGAGQAMRRKRCD